MRTYLRRIPWFLRLLKPEYTWRIKNAGSRVFLTFDDGPTPGVTDRILDILQTNDARATFFCRGDQVEKHPELFARIISEGHTIGNHTYSHPDGWNSTDSDYLSDIELATRFIKSDLFRPPYGRIKRSQFNQIKSRFKVVMWDILSGDFDENISEDKCVAFVVNKQRPGCIVVFHDNVKTGSKTIRILEQYFARHRELGKGNWEWSSIPTLQDPDLHNS